ncbi:L-threonylcarbamoyladenylate synthase [Membranihabitans maritimus]|uniref:L-threonylcarbamoyladenylate synthase n=1 Tax=Membranihabitans maritimus TaxID=2904244 RepID=UPI001F01FFDE|nr:L-threonylcarbamoyladenylate synthase [Membranihabitans maritimus]
MRKEVLEIVEKIEAGKVVLYPTDTIWGLGCDPFNQDAVDRIFSIKKRAQDQPLILLVSDLNMLKSLVYKMHPKLENILYFNERPLTIIFKKARKTFAKGITSQSGSIALRIVQEPFCKEVISALGKPLVSTSANVSKSPFPKSFDEISSDILENVDYISQYHGQVGEDPQPSLIAEYSAKQKELIFLRN